MRSSYLIFGILILVLLSCSSDDSSPEPQPQNQDPGAFSLLQVADNDTDVELFPTFAWNASIDPDGDTVSYDVYVGLDGDPKEKVASNLNTTNFITSTKLNWVQQYYWKVVAKDGKGGERTSEVFSFNTRPVRVTKIEPTIPFTPRYAHSSVVYDDKMWLISGEISRSTKLNDVWSSADGITWLRQELPANATPPFNGRSGHSTMVFNNDIWTIAGEDAIPPSEREVWRGSETVTSWQFVGNAKFSGRKFHSSVVFDNRLWVIGGRDSNELKNDVWYSDDGITWNEVSLVGSIFSERFGHASAIFKNKIWIIGGVDSSINDFKNDIWSSEDGITWNEVLSNAPFSARVSHELIVFDNRLWVIGGFVGIDKNDIWYSEDGRNWIEATSQNSFVPVSNHTTLVFDNKIWVLGGVTENGVTNDIWTLE